MSYPVTCLVLLLDLQQGTRKTEMGRAWKKSFGSCSYYIKPYTDSLTCIFADLNLLEFDTNYSFTERLLWEYLFLSPKSQEPYFKKMFDSQLWKERK